MSNLDDDGRVMGEVCDQCRFFDFIVDNNGYCRRFAPSPGLAKDRDYRKNQERFAKGCPVDSVDAKWPWVETIDWCGDFQQRKS